MSSNYIDANVLKLKVQQNGKVLKLQFTKKKE